MMMMDVDGGTFLSVDSQHTSAWSEGWRPPGAQSAFIKWTGWTLAVTMVKRTAP